MKSNEECKQILLKTFKSLSLDEIKSDKSLGSVDIVIECEDKYFLLEEKDFFREFAHKLLKKDFKGNLEEAKIIEEFKKLTKEEKKILVYKSLLEKILSMDSKLKGTIIELYSMNIKKLKSSQFFYIYYEFDNFESFNQFIKIFNIILNFKRGNKIVSCKKLIDKLNKEKCNENKNNL